MLLARFESLLGSRTPWLGYLRRDALGQGRLGGVVLRLLACRALTLVRLRREGTLVLLFLTLLELLLTRLTITEGLFPQGAPLGFTSLLECLGGCALGLGVWHVAWLRLPELRLVRLMVTAGFSLQGPPFSLTLHASFLGRQALRLRWWRVVLSLLKGTLLSGLAFSQTTVRILLLLRVCCARSQPGRRRALEWLTPWPSCPGDGRGARTEHHHFARPLSDFRTGHHLW